MSSLAAERAPRTNLGGRPERPTILALEGHVEEIVLLQDDAELFRRAAVSIVHLASHIEDALAIEDPHRIVRATAAQRRLAHTIAARSTRLTNVGIPEVQRCYNALELAAG